ncbi:glycosyltransferase [Lutimaribacter saemankumensis]|uniref:Lipopolysaccharide biosynthesis protein, LPS:glycosyltransferase n=1 Tax=Lutimaribacter saemankumensis TaxID=490829 RepID=A0A1G8SUD6_9RHOB|nr:glycosyltransferase [Lutimaribacter saemankumensis]SDJ32200.1 Lipopolysaccharide biosynthesis protein, LPS:glycosyltransferase [Lutimaribacter saemankumensis]
MEKGLMEIVESGHEKVSDKWASYLPFYQKHLSPFQASPVRLLEIGIQNGGSLEVWSQFFPKAEIIVGCDINPKCGSLTYDDPRVRVFVGDAGTKIVKAKISKASEYFDIIIDDGSHKSEDIVKAFSLYFPMLKPGGVYIAEDLHASYFEDYQGGTEAPYSSLNFFKRLTDYVNREHWGADVPENTLLSYFSKHWAVDFDSNSLDCITEVIFSNSLVLVRKGHPGDNALGHRVVSGTSALVDESIKNLDLSEPLKRNESRNPTGPLSMRLEAYPGEARRLSAALKATADELEEKKSELAAAVEKAIAVRVQIEEIATPRELLKNLFTTLQYKILHGLSKSRPIVSKRAAARFARSAAKRDPSRLELTPTLSDQLLPIMESGFWDERWYRDRHWSEIETAAKRDKRILSPLNHYIIEGWKNGYEPSDYFPIKRPADLEKNPVTHFMDTVRHNGYQFEENVWNPKPQDISDYWLYRESREAKRVIYTCIVGHYDDLIQPKYIDRSSDYVCFTDRQDLLESKEVGVWKIRQLEKTLENATLTNRWHKMHPSELFADYEESLYVDGNINVLTPYIFEAIEKRGAEMLLPQHFSRSCISEELDEIVRTGRIDEKQARLVDNIIQKARSDGFPTNWGLTENNVIFRKHHDARIKLLMQEWWTLIETVAPRDQAHFCFLLWKHGFSFPSITFPNCRSLYKDFAVVRHNTPEEIQLRKVIEKRIEPIFDDGAVAIVLSCNEAFVNFLDVLLASVVANSSKERNYDIIILTRDVTDTSKQRIQDNYSSNENISIRFYDMTPVLAALTNMDLHIEGYVPVETYNKIFLNDILRGYEKVAYIDTDIILNRDIADLYDIDLCGRAIGASPNVANIHAANAGKKIKSRDFYAYLQKDLGIWNVDRYFQAGILLVDLSHRNTQKLFRKCVDKIKEINQPVFFDQCIFNSVFYGDVYYLSTEWNTVWYLQNYSHLRSTVPEDLFFDYARAFNKPSIIHFASGDKPTNKTDWRLGEYFWKYAVQTKSKDALLSSLSDDQRQSPQVVGAISGLTVIPEMIRILVHVHLYYEDQLPFMMEAISSFHDFPRDVYFTTHKGSKIDKAAVLAAEPGCKFIELPNLGYDIFPFIEVLRRVNLSQYDYILKLHTKAPRTTEQGDVYGIDVPGYTWRDELVGALAGSPKIASANIERLQKDKTIGALGCEDFIFNTHDNNEENNYKLKEWRSYIGVQSGNRYIGGTMFLARAFPFEHFKKLHNKPELFKGDSMSTKSHNDFAHVVERLCGIVIENEGMTVQGC